MKRSALVGALAGALALTLCARAGRAGTEEFSTFHPIAEEEDDESTIDKMLAAPPAFWRDSWERSPNALRTSQGCLTSGQWMVDTRLRFETSMGERARFGLDFTDYQADDATYQYIDLGFHWPISLGRVDAMFRPFHDKSRQDFGVGWSLGADTSAVQLKAMFVIEDMFNNLWAWRQTRVGDLAEPYQRHPYEPNLSLVVRQPRWRLDVGGRYLTPSRKQEVIDPAVPSYRLSTLWGVHGWAAAEFDAAGFTWLLDGQNKQVRSTYDESAPSGDTGNDMRRRWHARAGVRRALPWRTRAELTYRYSDRGEGLTAPVGVGEYRAIERVVRVETWTALRPTVQLQLGWMHDHVSVAMDPSLNAFTYGSRGENRLYLGLALRFGRVDMSGVEGIELDQEPYDVAHHHDKGFLNLQSAF